MHKIIVILGSTIAFRWDEKAGLRRDALSSQVIDALRAHELKIGYEETWDFGVAPEGKTAR